MTKPSEDSPSSQPLGLPLNDQLGWDINRALFAGECQRLAEWALIGPVQRAALESFAERLLAAERERCAKLCDNWTREGVVDACCDEAMDLACRALAAEIRA